MSVLARAAIPFQWGLLHVRIGFKRCPGGSREIHAYGTIHRFAAECFNRLTVSGRLVYQYLVMTLTKLPRDSSEEARLAHLRQMLLAERQRLDSLLTQVESELQRKPSRSEAKSGGVSLRQARPSPLDQVKQVLAATADLREENGKLSAVRIAKVFGISLSQLAGWLKRTKQAVSKTPDADSLQPSLEFFERVARLRGVTENDAEFRKWLRTSNATLGRRTPLDLLASGQWQALADKVNDMLTGAPT